MPRKRTSGGKKSARCHSGKAGKTSIEKLFHKVAKRLEGFLMIYADVKAVVDDLGAKADTLAAQVADLQARIAAGGTGVSPVTQADFDTLGSLLTDIQTKMAAIVEAAKPKQ